MAWSILFASLFLGVAGQLALKKGAVGSREKWRSPAVWVGLCLYGIASLLWLAVLSSLPLSVAYPVLALGYVLVVLASRVFFGEAITWGKITGCSLIIAGVWLTAGGLKLP